MPGLCLTITERGAKSFGVWGRWEGARNPQMLTLGRWPALSLQAARAQAREILSQKAHGVDPRAGRRQHKAAEEARRAHTFEAVLECYWQTHLSKQRQERAAAEIMRRELKAWFKRPIAEITRADVIAVADGIMARGTPYAARNMLSVVKTFFSFAVERGVAKARSERLS